MAGRIAIEKTFKLFIGGKFPRSESGRSFAVAGSHVAQASRKDLRDAVEAARKAQPGWAGASPYNRGQVLYRLAEMMEGKRDELARALSRRPARRQPPAAERRATQEIGAAIDRVTCFAGWADKYAHVLGCQNPVAGPYYNFTTPEPTGVVGVIAPDEPALLGLASLMLPPLCAGNAVVALASETTPIAAAVLAEACATSDLPGGVVNILTGRREELLPHFASHRDIDAIHAAGVSPAHRKALEEGVAENLKHVIVRNRPGWTDDETCNSPNWIEPFVEMKTIWHPSAT